MHLRQLKNNLLIFSLLGLTFFACSKEDEPVPLLESNTSSFDVGYVTIKVQGFPALIDSVTYTNISKGITRGIPVSSFVYDLPENLSVLTLQMATGNKNDQVRCCVNLNTSAELGIVFENIPPHSIVTSLAPPGGVCVTGTY